MATNWSPRMQCLIKAVPRQGRRWDCCWLAGLSSLPFASASAIGCCRWRRVACRDGRIESGLLVEFGHGLLNGGFEITVHFTTPANRNEIRFRNRSKTSNSINDLTIIGMVDHKWKFEKPRSYSEKNLKTSNQSTNLLWVKQNSWLAKVEFYQFNKQDFYFYS